MTSRRQRSLALAAVGLACAVHAAWIPAKAELAQHLLDRAWNRAQAGHGQPVPWPWADTWPVARIRFAERNIHLIVLAGATGRTLAFGPGHISGTALPGKPGNCVVSGHRDTHFAFLQFVLPGELIELESADGSRTHYRVTARHIIYDTNIEILEPADESILTLLTCYPFDGIVPGGPLRYVIRAEHIPELPEPPAPRTSST